MNRRLLAGAGVLVATGGLLAGSGILLMASALVSVARKRVRQMDPPPSELARRRLRQAKVATSAGREAWRSQVPSGQPA